MTEDQVAFFQNLMAFAGILVLSVPTFSLNLRKKELTRFKGIMQRRRKALRATALDKAAAAKAELADGKIGEWRRIDEICLYLGYGLLFLSSLWRLICS